MGEQGNPAFNQALLKRVVNLMGLFPVGTLVRMSTDELAVVTAADPASRTVRELNGRPAAAEYARLAGTSSDALSNTLFAVLLVVVAVRMVWQLVRTPAPRVDEIDDVDPVG